MDCPSYNGYQFPTGCVPTAVAQIMNYHKWPDIGEGSGSTEYNGGALTLDFEAIPFDWSNMEDEYDFYSSEQSKKAVAELMYACGVGIKACYGFLNMTGGSIIGARYFLTENMKYDSDIKMRYRYNYSPDEWNELIYNDLNSGLPVYCEGEGDSLGHAFVCDGYDGNGYFHINWGWNGYADGYFLLTDLNPTSDKDNFHKDMMLLTNIHKRTGEKQPLTVDLISQGEFKRDKYGQFAFDNIFNYSLKDFNGYFGVKAISKDGECHYFEYEYLQEIPAAEVGYSIALCYTGQYFWIPLDGKLPQGEYRLYQIYREEDGDYCDIKGLYGSPDYIEMSVDESGVCTFLPQEFNYDIEVTSAVVNGGVGFKPGLAYAGHELYNLRMTFVNNMDVPYNSGITYRITKDDMLIGSGESSWLLQPHSELTGGLGNGIAGNHIFEEGEYKIEFFDYGGKNIDREDFFFSVIEEPTPNLEVTEFSWKKDEKRDRLTIYITIDNLSEHHYQGEFEMLIDPPVNGYTNGYWWINGVEGGGSVELDWPFWDAATTFTEDSYQVNFYDHHGQPINETPFLLNLNVIAASEIELSINEWIGKIGESLVIEAKVLPDDATDKTLEWTSSDENVATVDSEGNVQAIGIGNAVIRVVSKAYPEVYAECSITVMPIEVASITLDMSEWSGHVGEEFTIKATVSPDDATDKTLEWMSSDENVATVDSEGNVQAIGIGNAVIRVVSKAYPEVYAECSITVNPIYVESIILDPTEWYGELGDEILIKATVLPENATDPTVEWSSSNSEIATVSEEGFVVLLKEGYCDIKAKAKDGSDVEAICVINITSSVNEFFVDPSVKIYVYDSHGLLIREGYGKEAFDNLDPGFYIIREGKITKRVIIHQ